MTTDTKKIWGIRYEEIWSDNYLLWKLYIKNPFYQDGVWRVGINEKLLREARFHNVNRFILKLGDAEEGKEIPMQVPTKKMIREKVKNSEYEDRPSMFENSKPMRIFYFSIIDV